MPTQDPFAFSLYAQLRDTPGNLVFSPMSVRIALEMAAAGARGKTADELTAVLKNATTQPSSNVPDNDSTVKLANSLWVQQGFPLNAEYRTTIVDQFSGELKSLDFEKDPKGAAKLINDWVTEKTSGKIANLFSPTSIQRSDRLVLVNAIYLKADWEKPFESSHTTSDPFKLSSSVEPISAPTMHARLSGQYFANDDLEAVSLPYRTGGLSMWILLPRKVDGLADLEKSLSAEKLADWTSHADESIVNLSLPKWKSGTALQLVPAMQAMGVHAAFDESADFSGISPQKLNIGQIVQQATIDVDEKGTEAAAATGVRLGASAIRRQTIVNMIVDHPFLFLIRNDADGPVLFLGRVSDPRGS